MVKAFSKQASLAQKSFDLWKKLSSFEEKNKILHISNVVPCFVSFCETNYGQILSPREKFTEITLKEIHDKPPHTHNLFNKYHST